MTSNDFGDYLSLSFLNNNSALQEEQLSDYPKNRILPFTDSPVYYVSMAKIRSLTKGEDVKTVYDVTFDVQGIDHKFEPGDTIGILPRNNEDEVEQLLTRLDLISIASKPYNLSILQGTSKKKAIIPVHIPLKGTIRKLFSNHLDIRSPPKKMFLRTLTRYTTLQEEIEQLQLFTTTTTQEYIQFIANHRTVLSVLAAFPSCHPPIERLLEYLPPLQPRPYSISSSPLLETSEKELHITFAVIDINEDIKGVCSGYLEDTIKNLEMVPQQSFSDSQIENRVPTCSAYSQPVPFYFRKANSFRLPADPLIPIIMIGPGTGIAPFLGFLQHRQLQTKEDGTKFGTSWLFYGCRYSDRDFLYKQEIEGFIQTGVLTKLFTSFSRENPRKAYVQDKIKEHGKDFIDKIINENASIFICGDAKNMAKDVKNTIISCLEDFQGFSTTDAEIFIKNLQQINRYIQDVWL